MIGLSDFIKRSVAGPLMSEKEFDLTLSRVVRSLASDHAIAFKPEETICDDATADAIFQASLDLLSQVGLYNMDTNRVILLGRDEALDVAKSVPKECTIGGNEDTVWLRGRSHDSKRPPAIVWMPAKNNRDKGGLEQTFIDTTSAYAQDKSELGQLARLLLAQLEGIENLADTAGELMWSRAIARWRRAIVKALGKPNMYLGHAVGVSVPAILAAYGEGLQETFNSSIPIHIMPELKLNWDRLKLAYLSQEMGVPPWTSASGVLGIYCRKGEEMALVNVANMLAQLCYGHGVKAHMGLADRRGDRTTRPVTQAHSASCRAVARNVGNPLGSNTLTKNGLGTAKSIYELTSGTIAQTCSGVAWIWGLPCHPGIEGEFKVDLDCILIARISRGVAGLARGEANELLEKVFALYETTWDVHEEGKPYPYYYDMKTLTPTQELVDLYMREEDRLMRLGVPMKGGPIP